jgi:hypothetical protein
MVGHASFEITASHRDLVEVGREGGEAVNWGRHHTTSV